MGALLSQLSGSLGKALMSTFFPVILFLSAFCVGVLPLYPYGLEIFRPFETLDTGWKALAFSFVAVVLTGGLFHMNTLVYRLFEGYPWQHSVIGRWLKRRQVQRFQVAGKTKTALLALVRSLPKGSPECRIARRRLAEISHMLEKDFPDQEELILPTRFGNVVRSFEVYPRRQYDISAIEVWPRLLSVIDSSYAGVINEAKTTVDFLLNSSLLAAALSYSTLLLGLRTEHLGVNTETSYWVLRIIAFAGLSYWFYAAAISPAQDWGQHVRSAFDLFRVPLLTKFGIAAAPATLQEERAIWHAITDQLVYPNAAPFAIPLRVTPPAANSRNGVALTVVRSILRKTGTGSTPIQLTVKNACSEDAKGVVVTDSPPPNMGFLEGSLEPHADVTVRRSDPLEFTIAGVPAQSCVTLQYQAITPGT